MIYKYFLSSFVDKCWITNSANWNSGLMDEMERSSSEIMMAIGESIYNFGIMKNLVKMVIIFLMYSCSVQMCRFVRVFMWWLILLGFGIILTYKNKTFGQYEPKMSNIWNESQLDHSVMPIFFWPAIKISRYLITL